jgi:hypothetical protein
MFVELYVKSLIVDIISAVIFDFLPRFVGYGGNPCLQK